MRKAVTEVIAVIVVDDAVLIAIYIFYVARLRRCSNRNRSILNLAIALEKPVSFQTLIRPLRQSMAPDKSDVIHCIDLRITKIYSDVCGVSDIERYPMFHSAGNEIIINI